MARVGPRGWLRSLVQVEPSGHTPDPTEELWLHSLGLLAMPLHIQVLALPLPIGGTGLP